jgi:L,D-peptidoglycan transpeptidase YkuD (ErfK/YbiS/YcfS/YnhG family)
MILDVWPVPGAAPHRGEARWGDRLFPCALGKSGVRADKREGDHATPLGRFPFRQVLYRPDREAKPRTALPTRAIAATDGWCDDVGDPAYNRPVTLPYAARHEVLWRADGLYDLVLTIGHNDDPVVKGAGSAVFVHVARPDGGGTEGCVAFRVEDLRWILAQADATSVIRILPAPAGPVSAGPVTPAQG